jgi:hypothetical protein
VIEPTESFEQRGSSHPSAVVIGSKIHVVYTARADDDPESHVLCHAVAPTDDPAAVDKEDSNPMFDGSGQHWDSRGVREGELYVGPEYVHLFYGGYDGDQWRIGHVRTSDFESFEVNPANPILSGTAGTFDEGSVLTPVVRAVDDQFLLVYAGDDNAEGFHWQTGMATTATPTTR